MWSPVRYVTTVVDADGLERLTGVPLAELTQRSGTFELHGTTMLSPEATVLIAEYACRKNPMPILDAVLEEEKQLREKSKHGDRSGKHPTSPEYEYEWYRKYHRPIHELLRQWCGHRATSLQERVTAAEAENIRLEAPVDRLIDALADEGNLALSHSLAQEFQDGRITAESVRPLIAPLHPSEIPIRYVTRPRRWS
ncbi:hypothetical protein [Kribbella antibiotica]|nr:hypothetical protein [Kribbella antibiotica]